MNFRVASQTFLDMAKLYQQDMDTARAYMSEGNIKERLREKGVNIDVRDFLPMITVMGIKGETREDRAIDIRNKLEELTAAFLDPEKEKREEYLSMLYYMIDDFANDFDPVTMNMNNPADVAKLLQTMLISQTIGVKQQEFPEFYNNRYPTPQARNLMDACTRFSLVISCTVAKMLETAGIFINPILSLPKTYPDEVTEIQYLHEEYEKGLLEEAKRTKGDLPPTNTLSFPISDSMIPYTGKNVRDIPKYSPEGFDLVKNYYVFLVQSTQLLRGTQNTQGLADAAIGDVTKAVYIDGKPFEDFAKEYYPNGIYNGIGEAVIGTCILGGKHKVDIVHAYPNQAGEMQYEAKTLRITPTPEQEKAYLMQFSWIRRTLFNWWPFKIETLQEKMDRIANDPKTDDRHTKILGLHKEKIEAGIVRKAEQQQQSQKSSEEEVNRRVTYAEAKAQLNATVSLWEKDSVIGVLGQQMGATYHYGKGEQVGLCEGLRMAIHNTPLKEKYTVAAPLFAKLVLYAQLCNERVANNGAPGETEKMLAQGDSIQESIENTAQAMAEDPVFKDMLLEKIGMEMLDTLVPHRPKFEELIVNGGHKRFWAEYQQRMEIAKNQNEPNAPENEMASKKQKSVEKPPI